MKASICANEDHTHAWYGHWYCYRSVDGVTQYLHHDGTWGACARAEDVYFGTKELCQMVLDDLGKPAKKVFIDVEI